MTKNECIEFYEQIASVAREIEIVRDSLMSVLCTDSIDCFDEVIEKLMDVAFKMIISTKFNADPPDSWTEQQFIAKYSDIHAETFLSLIVDDFYEDRKNRLQAIVDTVQKIIC